MLLLLGAAAEILLPILIRSAYRGDSLPVINRIIAGRDAHPVEYYLSIGWRTSRRALAALAVLWAITATVTAPRVTGRVAAWLGSLPEPPDALPPRPPSRGRRRLVAALAVLITVGSVAEMLLDPPWRNEHWPFSPYQMYSDMPKPTLVARRLYGVVSGTSGREIPLSEDEYVGPFDHSRLWSSWDTLDRTPARERVMPIALRDVLARYERRRVRGQHDGPRLDAVRLYRVYWADPRGSDQEVPGPELLWEVRTSTPQTPSR